MWSRVATNRISQIQQGGDKHQAYCKQCRKMSGNILENVPTIMLIKELLRREKENQAHLNQ